MVKGFSSFKEWFRGFESNFALIGGTACDLLLSDTNYPAMIELFSRRIEAARRHTRLSN